MPTCDRRVFVRKAIEYFERRNPFVDAELVIVDSGRWPLSTDDIRGHKYIRGIVGDPVGSQLNLGISIAQGEFILRQDDDDWYSPDWYDLSLKTVNEAPAGIAGITNFYSYNPFKNIACKCTSWGQPPETSHWSGSSMSFRKSIWDKVKFGSLRIGSDREFLLDVYKLNHTPRSLVPNGTNKYVAIRHETNLTGPGMIGTTHPEDLEAVKTIVGSDISFYEDLSEMIGMNEKFAALANIQKKLATRGEKPVGYPGWLL